MTVAQYLHRAKKAVGAPDRRAAARLVFEEQTDLSFKPFELKAPPVTDSNQSMTPPPVPGGELQDDIVTDQWQTRLGYPPLGGIRSDLDATQTLDTQWRHTHWPLLMVDTGYLFATYAFALRSDRFWPLWITAVQLLTVASHLATIVAPDFVPKIYSAIATFWVVPLLLSMVSWVYLDHRAFRRLEPNDPILLPDPPA